MKGTSNTYNLCTRWFRRLGVTDACHSLLCCMGWAETVFRLGRLLGWLFAKLGASFISLSANALLGLCCKEAIYFGEKNTISNQLLQKIEINKLWFWKLTFGWILLPILLGLGMLIELPGPDGICGGPGPLTGWFVPGRGRGILAIRGPWGPLGWLVWMGPEFVGPPSSDWRPKAWRKLIYVKTMLIIGNQDCWKSWFFMHLLLTNKPHK